MTKPFTIHRWLKLTAVLLLALTLAGCGQEKQEEKYAYLPSFFAIPENIGNQTKHHLAEEGIYYAPQNYGKSISLYSRETEESRVLFSLPENEIMINFGVAGNEERGRFCLLVQRWSKNDAGEILWNGESSYVVKCYASEGEVVWEKPMPKQEINIAEEPIFLDGCGRVFLGLQDGIYAMSGEEEEPVMLEYPEASAGIWRDNVFAEDEEGNVYLIQSSRANKQVNGYFKIYFCDVLSGELREVASVEGKFPVCAPVGTGFFFRDFSMVYSYDLQLGEMTPLFSLSESMLESIGVEEIPEMETGWRILCEDNLDGLGVQLVELEWREVHEAGRVTLAAMNPQECNTRAIQFDQKHPEYRMQILDYGMQTGDYEDRLRRLQLSLSSKDSPDLLEVWPWTSV